MATPTDMVSYAQAARLQQDVSQILSKAFPSADLPMVPQRGAMAAWWCKDADQALLDSRIKELQIKSNTMKEITDKVIQNERDRENWHTKFMENAIAETKRREENAERIRREAIAETKRREGWEETQRQAEAARRQQEREDEIRRDGCKIASQITAVIMIIIMVSLYKGFRTATPADEPVRQPTSNYLERFQKAMPFLVHEINGQAAEIIINELMAARDGQGMITAKQQDAIKALATTKEKVQYLLDIINDQGDIAIDVLAQALESPAIKRPDWAQRLRGPAHQPAEQKEIEMKKQQEAMEQKKRQEDAARLQSEIEEKKRQEAVEQKKRQDEVARLQLEAARLQQETTRRQQEINEQKRQEKLVEKKRLKDIAEKKRQEEWQEKKQAADIAEKKRLEEREDQLRHETYEREDYIREENRKDEIRREESQARRIIDGFEIARQIAGFHMATMAGFAVLKERPGLPYGRPQRGLQIGGPTNGIPIVREMPGLPYGRPQRELCDQSNDRQAPVSLSFTRNAAVASDSVEQALCDKNYDRQSPVSVSVTRTAGVAYDSCDQDEQVRQPTSDYLERFQNNRSLLALVINGEAAEIIVDKLMAARDGQGMITAKQRDAIKAQVTAKDKVRCLLDLINNLGECAIDILVKTLDSPAINRPDMAQLLRGSVL